MASVDLKILLDQYITETISEEDYRVLWTTLRDPAYAEQWHALTADIWDNESLHPVIDPQKEQVLMRLEQLLKEQPGTAAPETPAPRRIHPLYKWRWAAAVILLLGAGAYLRNLHKKQPLPPAIASATPAIQPGRQGAILTLANGSNMLLDTIRDGVVALQGGATARIVKGKLVYEAVGKEVVYNTMSTPKGRQFQLTLPDGTRVWLDAASSIHYPTVFSGADRRVSITGEAYFEVARNTQMPFRVRVNNQAEVEVLGTHFNVNAYDDEENVNTTLLEGSVRVNRTILRPGQQAQLKNGAGAAASIRIIKDPDIEKVMAWKNGLFNFENASLREVMRQLERWYDVEVVYTGTVPNGELEGKMTKDITLNGLLVILKKLGVHCQLEDRRLIVSP